MSESYFDDSEEILDEALEDLWKSISIFSTQGPDPPLREFEEVMENFAPTEDTPYAFFSANIANAAVASVAEDVGLTGANLGVLPGERGRTLYQLVEAARDCGKVERWPGWTRQRAEVRLRGLVAEFQVMEAKGEVDDDTLLHLGEELGFEWLGADCRKDEELANEIIREFAQEAHCVKEDGSTFASEQLQSLHLLVRQANSRGYPIWIDIEEGE